MKRKLFLLFAFFGLLLLTSTGCRMRYARTPSYAKVGHQRDTKRHFRAKKNIWQRTSLWGKKRYGPRPYRHRGWQRQ